MALSVTTTSPDAELKPNGPLHAYVGVIVPMYVDPRLKDVPTHAGLLLDTSILKVSTITVVVPVAIQPDPADDAVTV